MFGNIGSGELVIISVILLVFFGNRKMKVIARGLGKSTKEIKKLQSEVEKTLQGVADDIENETKEAPVKPSLNSKIKKPKSKIKS
jgi:sec-independent protein translocase protein TatA